MSCVAARDGSLPGITINAARMIVRILYMFSLNARRNKMQQEADRRPQFARPVARHRIVGKRKASVAIFRRVLLPFAIVWNYALV
jgi:hypothetical protein